MTEKDLIIEEQRRTIKRLETELRDAKAMLQRLSRYVPDETFATIALEMTKTPTRINAEYKTVATFEEFWRGE